MPNHDLESYAPNEKMLGLLFDTFFGGVHIWLKNENLSKIKPPLGKAAGAQQAPLTQLEWNTDSKAKKQRRRSHLL